MLSAERSITTDEMTRKERIWELLKIPSLQPTTKVTQVMKAQLQSYARNTWTVDATVREKLRKPQYRIRNGPQRKWQTDLSPERLYNSFTSCLK